MNSKYYYKINCTLSLEEAISDYKNKLAKTPELKFVLLSNGKAAIEEKKKLFDMVEFLSKSGIKRDDIIVSIYDEKHTYQIGRWLKLKKVAQEFEEKNITFGFEDMANTFSVNDVENANYQIIETAEIIKESAYSPLETLLSVYLRTQSRHYTKEGESENPSLSRSIYGVLNSDRIVCVGYCELFKAVINEIGDKNIKIFDNHVKTQEDNDIFGSLFGEFDKHRNLIVYLKDEKYNIEGFYYLDPTWDCSQTESNTANLNYFLIPLQDISKIKTKILDNDSKSDIEFVADFAPKGKDKTILYNSPEKRENLLSFSSEKFVCNNEFLEFLAKKPKFRRKITDFLYNERILDKKQNKNKTCAEQIKLAENTSAENIVRDLIAKYGYSCSGLDSLLLQNSKPINLNYIAKALWEVLNSEYAYDSEEDVSNAVQYLIDANCKQALRNYESGAINPLFSNSQSSVESDFTPAESDAEAE